MRSARVDARLEAIAGPPALIVPGSMSGNTTISGLNVNGRAATVFAVLLEVPNAAATVGLINSGPITMLSVALAAAAWRPTGRSASETQIQPTLRPLTRPVVAATVPSSAAASGGSAPVRGYDTETGWVASSAAVWSTTPASQFRVGSQAALGLYYDRLLTDEQIMRVVRWLARRYGVTTPPP